MVPRFLICRREGHSFSKSHTRRRAFSSSARRWLSGRGSKRESSPFRTFSSRHCSIRRPGFPFGNHFGLEPGQIFLRGRPSADIPWAGIWQDRTCRKGYGSARFPPTSFLKSSRIWYFRIVHRFCRINGCRHSRQPFRRFQGKPVAGMRDDDGLPSCHAPRQGAESGIALSGNPQLGNGDCFKSGARFPVRPRTSQ